MMVELSLASLQLQATGGLEDAVPDVVELVAASIPVQVCVEHSYVHRLPDPSIVLIYFMFCGGEGVVTPPRS